MKKQYMDFVPGRKAATAAGAKTAGVKTAGVKVAAGTTAKVVMKMPTKTATRSAAKTTTKAAPAKMKRTEQVSFSNEGKLGVVEGLSSKFVKTNVPKRPLSSKSHTSTEQSEIAKIKARKVVEKSVEKPVKKSVEKSIEKVAGQTMNKSATETYQMPKTPFINQGKVEKRPLSKNVYAKKIAVVAEEPKGPVTIISKPESQAHVGLIVAIILTIILGAAAGTVAFLLLPK